MKKHRILLACLFATGWLLSLNAAEELPQKIAPSDPRIALQGAWTEDYQAAWTGVGFKVQTDAPEMNILIKDYAKGGLRVNPEEGYDNNYLNIRIDDQEPQVLALQSGETRYAVEGLDGKPHTVSVFRRTEPSFRQIQFLGLELPAGTELMAAPKPADIQIQVIGDSISAGYGNESNDIKSPFLAKTENGDMTYWAIVAREMNADVRCAAWSGQGVLRNRKGKTTNQLPEIWRSAMAYGKLTPERNDAQWTPNIAIINLGTNDSAMGVPPKEEFIAAYQALIDDIRTTSPDATIYVVFGPLLREPKDAEILNYLNELAAANKQVYVVKLTNEYGKSGLGSHWHPTVQTHQSMAEQLLSAIREHE